MKKISLLKFLSICGKGNKSDSPEESLLTLTNKMSRKVMVSAAILWYSSTKSFFVNNNGIKINKENYCQNLGKELSPAIEKVVKRYDWTFAQDGALSLRSHLEQDFLKTKLKCRFIRAEQWPPSLPDINPLDYFYWDFFKIKVYEGRNGKPFASEDELQKKIKSVWNICAYELVPIRKAIKQFVPRMKAVEEKQGKCIKMLFG